MPIIYMYLTRCRQNKSQDKRACWPSRLENIDIRSQKLKKFYIFGFQHSQSKYCHKPLVSFAGYIKKSNNDTYGVLCYIGQLLPSFIFNTYGLSQKYCEKIVWNKLNQHWVFFPQKILLDISWQSQYSKSSPLRSTETTLVESIYTTRRNNSKTSKKKTTKLMLPFLPQILK